MRHYSLKKLLFLMIYWHYKSQRLEYVCVLAASLGGPAAVKEFLDYVPAGLACFFCFSATY
jgi:chemotaxis response regulator CheB